MSFHSESVDEHAGEDVVDLVGLSPLEEGSVPASIPFPLTRPLDMRGLKRRVRRRRDDQSRRERKNERRR